MPSRSPSSFDGTNMGPQQAGQNGPSIPVPPEEEALTPGPPLPTDPFAPADPFGIGTADPFAQPGSAGSSPATRVLRRCLDSDSLAGGDGRPQALLHLRRRPESGGSLVLRSGPLRALFSSAAGEARTSRRTTRGISPASRATTKENGRPSSHGPFAQPRAPRSRPESSCRSPSRSGTGSRASVVTGVVSRSGTPLYLEPEVVASAVGPMVRMVLLILAIELAVIFRVRRRYGSGVREEPGGEPRLPATTRA